MGLKNEIFEVYLCHQYGILEKLVTNPLTGWPGEVSPISVFKVMKILITQVRVFDMQICSFFLSMKNEHFWTLDCLQQLFREAFGNTACDFSTSTKAVCMGSGLDGRNRTAENKQPDGRIWPYGGKLKCCNSYIKYCVGTILWYIGKEL